MRTCYTGCPPPPTHTPRPHTGFPMSAHLSRLRSFSDICGAWFGFGSGFRIGFTLLLARSFTRSPSSRHPLFTQYPFPPRSLVCGGQTSTQVSTRRISYHMRRCTLAAPVAAHVVDFSCCDLRMLNCGPDCGAQRGIVEVHRHFGWPIEAGKS